ncbi:MAG: SUMF1/EgtB/PvdO family nonheme iron enzyme [Bacteroidetes bacterium]|nr:SUMF1/EgtB/PvdO family nonheme iron enzyme [Bacteroidota bacterium]
MVSSIKKGINSVIVIKDTIINNFQFVSVPKGEFTYGINDEIKSIDYDFFIMKYEVTNQQYFDFLKATIEKKILKIKKDTIVWYYEGDNLRPKGYYTAKILDDRIFYRNNKLQLDTIYSNHPVTEVTWFGSTVFCNWYQLKLPDQFEWEKAARGMTGWNYPWGDTLDSRNSNFHDSGDPFDNGTTPVGFYNGQTYKGYQTINSSSPYGCYDMAGNAWEYTNSLLDPKYAYPIGAGGGYLYHTGAMTQSWFRSTFGLPYPNRIDRPFKSDGFRCIIK